VRVSPGYAVDALNCYYRFLHACISLQAVVIQHALRTEWLPPGRQINCYPKMHRFGLFQRQQFQNTLC